MDIIYTLIPSMLIIGLVLVGILIYMAKKGQFDDLEGDGNRILMDDDDPLLPDEMRRPMHGEKSDDNKVE